MNVRIMEFSVFTNFSPNGFFMFGTTELNHKAIVLRGPIDKNPKDRDRTNSRSLNCDEFAATCRGYLLLLE